MSDADLAKAKKDASLNLSHRGGRKKAKNGQRSRQITSGIVNLDAFIRPWEGQIGNIGGPRTIPRSYVIRPTIGESVSMNPQKPNSQ